MSSQDKDARRRRILWTLALLSVIAGVVAFLVGLRRKRQVKKPAGAITPPDILAPSSLVGLSEAEADSKRLKGQDNAIAFKPQRSLRDILRDNILTIFNLSLVGVAFVQLLLGLYWDMLLSLGIAVLNISLNVFQELFTKRHLQALERDTRPQATVIREGKARSIDPMEIVQEDVLVVGTGDQIQVDGEILSENPILVDESILIGKGNRLTKHQGDMLYAGSFCISGRAAYQAQKVGDERLVASLLRKSKSNNDELTPLEKIVKRVLNVMLWIVVIMVSLILSHMLHLDSAVGLDTDVIVSRVSVVFSLAPAGLYFMIFLNYVSGVRQLAKQGALIHRARSVETLAHASTLWVSLEASRAGIGVRVEDILPSDKNYVISESRLLQILADFARTSSSSNQAVMSLADLFPGDRRSIREQSPFLSVYGWAAVAFDEDDLRGVYVFGEKQVLDHFLVAQTSSRKKESGEQKPSSSLKNRLSILKRLWRRSDDQSEGKEETMPTMENEHSQVDSGDDYSQIDTTSIAKSPKEGRFQRLFSRIGRVLKRKPAEDEDKDAEKTIIGVKQPEDEVVYLFAYYPELVQLHDKSGQPQLPKGLIPLCYLHYTTQENPEAVNTIRTLRNCGVNPKVFSPGDSSRVTKILESAGMNQESSAVPNTISGPELVGLDQDALYQAANENVIFNHVTSDQTCDMVVSMREHGDTIAVFGGNPSDLAIMQNANLSITSQSSSQAALSTADIILLKEAPKGLLTVMRKGQSIVRSLLDVLKLYLTELLYLTTLILVLWALDLGFPYLSQQGSFITIVTLTLPSLALSLWEMPGALQRVSLSRQLGWFVGPATLSISTSGILLYTHFLKQSNQMAYAQLALTHMLVISGLTLFVIVRPPKRSGLFNSKLETNWRTVILAIVLLAAYHFFASLPIAFKWFRLAHLQQPGDYLVVVLAVLAWVVTVQSIWWIMSAYSGKKSENSNITNQGTIS